MYNRQRSLYNRCKIRAVSARRAFAALFWDALRQSSRGRREGDDVPVDHCLSLLFHVSLWGLRYGIQMEEVLRALGAHYTDVYQSETLAAKRDFVLACLFGCQQALAARRRSHSHAVKSVAMRVREYVDAEYCSNNNALFESYSRLVRQERIGAIYMPARREVLDFRDPNQVTTLLVKRFEALDVANPDKLGRFFFYPLQKNFLSTETYGEPRRDMVVLGSRRVYSALKSGYPYVHIFAIEEQDIYDLYQYQARRMGAAVYVLTEEGELISSTDEAAVAAGQAPAALLENAAALDPDRPRLLRRAQHQPEQRGRL